MSKIALITTTIHPSEVLRLYRAIGPEIPFFVTGDKKSPHHELRNLARELGDVHYYDVRDQEKLDYKSLEVTGWNTIRRRNVALLEALRHGAEKIVTIDVDNYPMDHLYFHKFDALLSREFSGLMVDSSWGWFNVGDFFTPRIYHRGFPVTSRGIEETTARVTPVVGKKVGVAAGLWFGDPDIDAMDRMVNRPMIHQISQVLHSGIIVKEWNFSPFDSQNTAFLRELAPLMMMLEVGRYDDIWASYLAQRIMFEKGYHVHYGPPFVFQERNLQDLRGNLEDEIYGMKHTSRFGEHLTKISLEKGGILDMLKEVYEDLTAYGKDYLPQAMLDQFPAWLSDLELVM